MTSLREAAQQALRALEMWVDETQSITQQDAITALRAALEQQAEPVEPVAWMDPASGDVISDARHEAWERDFGLTGKGKAALFTVPLYTTPPQRKPLPNHDQHCVDVPGYGLMAVRLVRAVERAHGIGEGA